MKRVVCVLVCVSVCVALAGCPGPKKDAPPSLAKVSGTVSVGGSPMDEGEAHFNSPGHPAKVLKVARGAFSGEVFAGKNSVSVVQVKEKPSPMGKDQPPVKETVEFKFKSGDAALSLDVPDSGKEGLKLEVIKK